MRRPFAAVYIVFTVVFFLAVVGVAGYRIAGARELGQERAADHFRDFYLAVNTRLDQRGAVDPELARTELMDRLDAPTGLRTVLLYSLREGVYYLWAADRNRISPAAAAEAADVPDLPVNPLLEERFLNSITLDGRSVILEGIYRVLNREDFVPILRDSLIALLAFAVLTLATAVAGILRNRRRVAAAPTAGGDTETAPPEQEAPERPAPAEPSSPEQSWPEPPPPEPPTPEPPAPETEAQSLEEPVPEEAGSTSLFSETSGVGHREHLERRLTLELERAAYNEQDLAAALAAFPGLKGNSAGYRATAEMLVDRFGFRDLIFEYDDESFCIILPNTDLDEAIQMIEDFQRTAAGRLAQESGEPFFGLSARTGRLVDGPRLILEARSALQRAAAAAGRIIGFRPDPRKYRQHVQSTQAGSDQTDAAGTESGAVGRH